MSKPINVQAQRVHRVINEQAEKLKVLGKNLRKKTEQKKVIGIGMKNGGINIGKGEMTIQHYIRNFILVDQVMLMKEHKQIEMQQSLTVEPQHMMNGLIVLDQIKEKRQQMYGAIQMNLIDQLIKELTLEAFRKLTEHMNNKINLLILLLSQKVDLIQKQVQKDLMALPLGTLRINSLSLVLAHLPMNGKALRQLPLKLNQAQT